MSPGLIFRLFVCAAIIAAVSFAAGQLKPLKGMDPDAEKQYLHMTDELKSLYKNELLDYVQTKNDRDRAAVGDVISLKLLKLISLRKEKWSEEERLKYDEYLFNLEKNASEKTIFRAKSETERNQKFVDLTKSEAWQIKEENLIELTDREKIPEVLKTLQLENLEDYLDYSTAFAPEDAQTLQGSFEGTLRVDSINKTFPVSFSLKFDVYEETSGNYKFQVKDENGKVKFERIETGSLVKLIRRFPSDSFAFLMDASEGYLQLYSLGQLGILAGIYYEKQAGRKFIARANFFLERKK